jgi:hypothetical protein
MCRDAFEGQGAIKAAGESYLPKLTEQSVAEYNAYKNRALFYSITNKTVSALVGMATTKAPTLTYPTDMDAYFKDDSGVQFYEILAKALSENLLLGRYGLLVDRPKNGGKPIISGYEAESIINWRLDDLGNPTLVVLTETIEVQDPTDTFLVTHETQYRVLRLEEVEGKSTYTVELFDKDEKSVSKIVPLNTGLQMDYIPFYAVNPMGVGWHNVKPPVLDIVDINISHYRSSADLEHGRHFTGLPTPVISGVDTKSKMAIGSTTAWVLPDKDARAYFLEFTGQGLLSLEKALTEKQSQLASLSARLIGQSSNGSEAAETVRLRYTSETASLTSVVRSVEALLNRVYKTVARMEALDETAVSVLIDKEFLSSKMSGAEIKTFVDSYLAGGISKETLVFNLRRGDALSPDRKDLEELGAILDPADPSSNVAHPTTKENVK